MEASRCRWERGVSLVELLVVLFCLGILMMVALPAYRAAYRRLALRSATVEVRLALHHARTRAVGEERNVAVKFNRAADGWNFAVYGDQDGDGVRNNDIKKGIDVLLSPPRPIGGRSRIGIGLPVMSIRDPHGKEIEPGSSPVRFNSSTLCSFSSVGDGTPGSVYLSDGHETRVVVVTGETGEIRTFVYNPESRGWEKM